MILLNIKFTYDRCCRRTVVEGGCCHHDHQEQSQCIHHDMPLPPVDFLAAIVAMFAAAFRRLDRKDIQLLLIGKGGRIDEIRELVNSLGLEKDILFLGYKRNPFKYLGRSDCFVFVSNFEGQGQVMMEAMACDLPVISTDCETGPREVLAPGTSPTFNEGQNVEYGKYGVLVPVGNAQALTEAMLEMIEDSEFRRLYREKGLERAGDYDKEIVLAEIRPIIYELLDSATTLKNERAILSKPNSAKKADH